MITNPEKTIYALYHKNIYDTNLYNYRNLDGASLHKIVIKLLASISLNGLIERQEKFDIDTFIYAMYQWLFSLVIRDKKIMNIIKIEDHVDIPWTTYFKDYNDNSCEFIRLEKNGDSIDINFSPLIFDSNSVLFRQFIITLMADRFKDTPVEEPIQLVYVFCSELCQLIASLKQDKLFVKEIENSFNISMKAARDASAK